ncbi:nucleotidyltransferase family protein [Zavarzinia compransoris]|uniref:nucleotidyltransferase family protein n=1 Tax=Zavarzinia compransoris TaxID=1264899 RepID=UPI0014152EA2|nr:nucleotidyltransferase domain-containing protein [Zavarzinia compransoris]
MKRLRDNREGLAALGVVHAYLFGSVARDAATAASDIDVMVDLDEGPGGRKPLFSAFDVGGIQSALAGIFGRPVDLVVRRDALRPGRRLRAVAESQLLDVF